MKFPEQRQAVIVEAFSWKGTPFDFGQCVKGERGGVDCGRFPAACLNSAGVKKIVISELGFVPNKETGQPERLSPQWFLHRDDVSFLDLIRPFAVEYRLGTHKAVPEPADMVVAKCGRDWAHCALVIQWPRVIGAAMEHVVTLWDNIYRSPQYMNRELAFFDPWGDKSV